MSPSTSLRVALALSSAAGLAAAAPPPPDEGALGPFVVTGTEAAERVTRLAVLPSLSPELSDVVVRSVVRRDLELSGMFQLLKDDQAPAGDYGFEAPVDVAAWRQLGAEVIVKVGARAAPGAAGHVEVSGLCYFLETGAEPVYQKRLTVPEVEVRVTAHRITDALLGAITGRPGGFASRMTFSARWGRHFRVMTMDADGHGLTPVTSPTTTSIAPVWGPGGALYYAESKDYAPFQLMRLGSPPVRVALGAPGSVYSVSFDPTGTKLAVALSSSTGSSIWVGKSDGTELRVVSTTPLATHPEWTPSGKLAWIGGSGKSGDQRVYVDGKAVSPLGFTAAAPVFCDTEDGVRLIYSVAVGGNKQDLVMSSETGKGIQRLTQNQGSNTSPACSSDGRLLAFFSTRDAGIQNLYLMSLKRWKTQRLAVQSGESLRWAPLPPTGTAP